MKAWTSCALRSRKVIILGALTGLLSTIGVVAAPGTSAISGTFLPIVVGNGCSLTSGFSVSGSSVCGVIYLPSAGSSITYTPVTATESGSSWPYSNQGICRRYRRPVRDRHRHHCAGKHFTPPFVYAQSAGSQPVTVTIPPSGTLTVSVAPGTAALAESGSTATGMLPDATVTDTRNTYPGWSASAQVSVFTGSGTAAGSTIPGDDLGWVPLAVDPLVGGATLGPAVAPGTSPGGLGDVPAVLAEASPGSGFGTNTLGADLTLDKPSTAVAGPYAALLTITYMEAGP
jgi:hypothetical protein